MKKLIFCLLPAMLVLSLLILGRIDHQAALETHSHSDSTFSATKSAPTILTTTAHPTISSATVPPTTIIPPATTQPSTQSHAPVAFSMRTVTDTALYATTDAHSQPLVCLARNSFVDVSLIGPEWSSVVWEGDTYYIPSAHIRQKDRYLVVIDAGHQRYGNLDLEPDGPGSSTYKFKVSYGTTGCASGLAEFELNLMVAFKLQEELESRGYDVAMVRTTHDVDISNSQRSMFANDLYADAFIRIHANGSDDPQAHGIMTICQGRNNPYNSHLYAESRELSYAVLDEVIAATDARREYVWETNSMSGINWCQVPVTIVEIGYMTNEAEDLLMSTTAYQYKLAMGIANGIDVYFYGRNP